MIDAQCKKCGAEIQEKAALLISPPIVQQSELVRKIHVCRRCWSILEGWLGFAIRQPE